MKQMLFVLNPRSGREQIRNKLLTIVDTFIKAGYEVQIHVTQREKDARDVVKERGAGKDIIVCSGGDGTLNETISGIMELEEKPVLGYIPAGSTNDFASSLGLPKKMEQAAEYAVYGSPYKIDIGKFNADKYFIYIAAFGIFTEISYTTPQDKKNILGHQAYILEGVKSLSALKSYRMKVEWEDQALEGDFVFGMITNTISVGGFKGLVPQSVALNDGEFEVLLIRRPKTPIDLSNIVSYMFLKEEPNDYVHKFKASSLRITSETVVDWVLDGEFGGSHTEVRIDNIREALEIRKIQENPVENV